jgi:DNA-binding transcriptional LysR family regulator
MVALLAHQGIAVLPHWMIAPHVEQSRLRRILEGFTPMSLPISIVFPKARHVPPKVHALVDFLESTIRERCLLPD